MIPMTVEVYDAWLILLAVAVVHVPQALNVLCHMRADVLKRRARRIPEENQDYASVFARGRLACDCGIWHYRASRLAAWYSYAAISVSTAQAISAVKNENFLGGFILLGAGVSICLLGRIVRRIHLSHTVRYVEIAALCKKQVSLLESVP